MARTFPTIRSGSISSQGTIPDREYSFRLSLMAVSFVLGSRTAISSFSRTSCEGTEARRLAGGSQVEPVHDVVQAPLEHLDQVFAGDALMTHRLAEEQPELSLQHPVHPLQLLFFVQLHAVIRNLLGPAARPLAGCSLFTGDGALGSLAPVSLEVELVSLGPAQPALGTDIPSHCLSSLHAPLFRRPAPVMGNRGDVLDGAHADAQDPEGPDGRLAADTGALHEHDELVQALLQRLGRGGFRRGLRGERGRLLCALEPQRSRRGPGDG